MTYTGVNASHKAVSYRTQNSVSKYGVPSFWLLARVRSETFKTKQAVTIPLGCSSHLVLRPTTEHTLYLDPRTWANQAGDDLDASTLMVIFP